MEKIANLNFHQTFYPEMQYISKINIEVADKFDGLTKEEISSITGIPTGAKSGKVEPHIFYSYFMNLICYEKKSGKYKIFKTKLGELIASEDPYFLEDTTKIICNYFLTSKRFGADMWFFICRKLTYQLGNELREELIKESLEKVFNTKSLNLTPFRSCYLSKNSFQSIDFVEINNDNYYFKSFRYNPQHIFIYAYTLILELEEFDKNRKEFTTHEIFDVVFWNRGYGWNENEGMYVLEKLYDRGIISLNRQLSPATVIINKSSDELLKKVYSMLF